MSSSHQPTNPSKSALLYPLIGISFTLRHRFLWPLIRSRILPLTLLTTLTTTLLLLTLYLPQATLLAIFHGRAAFVNALVLTLAESAAITQIFFEAFLADRTCVNVFDATLLHTYPPAAELLSELRPVLHESEADDPRQRLGPPHTGGVFYPFSLRQIVEFVLLLPLTAIPWIGVPLFLWGTGYRSGPLLLHRYFKLKGLPKDERKAWMKKRRRAVTCCGVCAVTLQLVPGLSMLFLLTTAAGVGVWAGRLEAGEASERIVGDSDERADGVTRPEAGEEGRPNDRLDREAPPPPYTEYGDDVL